LDSRKQPALTARLPSSARPTGVERGDDLTAVAVSGDHGRAFLELEYLAKPGDVVCERVERELRCSHLEAIRLQALDDAAPDRTVGPCAMDENDVRPKRW